MRYFQQILRVLLFTAVATLVVNDFARIIFPEIQQLVMAASNGTDEQEDNNPINPFSLLEEEVKHHHHRDTFQYALYHSEEDLRSDHLIKDDDIRVLAFITIFSPPPNPFRVSLFS